VGRRKGRVSLREEEILLFRGVPPPLLTPIHFRVVMLSVRAALVDTELITAPH
jgi:hypothetical protein